MSLSDTKLAAFLSEVPSSIPAYRLHPSPSLEGHPGLDTLPCDPPSSRRKEGGGGHSLSLVSLTSFVTYQGNKQVL